MARTNPRLGRSAAAAKPAQTEAVTALPEPAEAERDAPESAIVRADRLKREVAAAEAEHGAITAELAALALDCEQGHAKALARRAALRGDLARLADLAGDKRAALAAVAPLAEIERQQEARERRDRAFAEVETLLGWAAGWAKVMDRGLAAVAEATAKLQAVQAAIMAATHLHVPSGSHWLMEMPPDTMESVLLARLCRLGALGPINSPGVMWTGNATVHDAVAQHGDSVRARLASIQREADRPARGEETLPAPQPQAPPRYDPARKLLLPAA